MDGSCALCGRQPIAAPSCSLCQIASTLSFQIGAVLMRHMLMLRVFYSLNANEDEQVVIVKSTSAES